MARHGGVLTRNGYQATGWEGCIEGRQGKLHLLSGITVRMRVYYLWGFIDDHEKCNDRHMQRRSANGLECPRRRIWSDLVCQWKFLHGGTSSQRELF